MTIRRQLRPYFSGVALMGLVLLALLGVGKSLRPQPALANSSTGCTAKDYGNVVSTWSDTNYDYEVLSFVYRGDSNADGGIISDSRDCGLVPKTNGQVIWTGSDKDNVTPDMIKSNIATSKDQSPILIRIGIPPTYNSDGTASPSAQPGAYSAGGACGNTNDPTIVLCDTKGNAAAGLDDGFEVEINGLHSGPGGGGGDKEIACHGVDGYCSQTTGKSMKYVAGHGYCSPPTPGPPGCFGDYAGAGSLYTSDNPAPGGSDPSWHTNYTPEGISPFLFDDATKRIGAFDIHFRIENSGSNGFSGTLFMMATYLHNYKAICLGNQAWKDSGQQVITTVDPGQVFEGHTTFQNSGGYTWSQVGQYKMGDYYSGTNPPTPADPPAAGQAHNKSYWGTGRVELSSPYVNPISNGPDPTIAEFFYNVTAPPDPGLREFSWQMLQEGVTWIPDPCVGSLTIRKPYDYIPTVTLDGISNGGSGSLPQAGATINFHGAVRNNYYYSGPTQDALGNVYDQNKLTGPDYGFNTSWYTMSPDGSSQTSGYTDVPGGKFLAQSGLGTNGNTAGVASSKAYNNLSLTTNATAPDGTWYCIVTQVDQAAPGFNWPYTQAAVARRFSAQVTWDDNGNVVGNPVNSPNDLCVQVQNPRYPYLDTQRADVAAGGQPLQLGAVCTAPSGGRVAGQVNAASSTGQYIVAASSDITSFYSHGFTATGPSPINDLTFSASPGAGQPGGSYGALCRPNIAASAQKFKDLGITDPTHFSIAPFTSGSALPASPTPNTLYYNTAASTTTSGGQVNGRFTLYVVGDLVITGNITYSNPTIDPNNTDPSAPTSLAHMPSFGVVATGRIFINPSVTQLDGYYYAGSSIDDCRGANIQTNASSCAKPLYINGLMMAQSFRLGRTGPVGTLGAQPGELVNYPVDPNGVGLGNGNVFSVLYLATPPAFSNVVVPGFSSLQYQGEEAPLY